MIQRRDVRNDRRSVNLRGDQRRHKTGELVCPFRSVKTYSGQRMTYQIRQLNLGGILDQAIAIVKDNFMLLAGILMIVWVPYQLIAGAVNLVIMPDMAAAESEMDLAAMQQEVVVNLIYTLPLTLIGLFIVLPLTNAAMVFAVAQLYLGYTITPIEAIRLGLRKIVPLVGTSVLMGLAIFGGLLLCLIPGILAALWFGLAQHVVILEDTSGVAALKRSKTLITPYLGTFLILGVILTIIGAMIGGGSALIPIPWLQMLVMVALQGAMTLFSTAAFVVFYFSCRCGIENFDLEYLAASVGGDAAPPTSTDSPFA